LGSLWDLFGISLGSLWDLFGISLGSLGDLFGISWGLFIGSHLDTMFSNMISVGQFYLGLSYRILCLICVENEKEKEKEKNKSHF